MVAVYVWRDCPVDEPADLIKAVDFNGKKTPAFGSKSRGSVIAGRRLRD